MTKIQGIYPVYMAMVDMVLDHHLSYDLRVHFSDYIKTHYGVYIPVLPVSDNWRPIYED